MLADRIVARGKKLDAFCSDERYIIWWGRPDSPIG
jgi:hypothetical protein